MNILTGYLSATAGQVTVDGVDILDDPVGVKKKIGYLPEQPPLYMEMTVKEYLSFVYDLKGVEFPKEPHLAEVMEVTHTADVSHRLISQLSKGYKQRVGIAAALVGDPPILIFDEPTVGLDPKQIIEVRNLLRTLGKKRTVILSTHILPEVQAVCERIIVINRGRIVADERTDEVARRVEGESRFRITVAGGTVRDITVMLREKCGARKVEALPGRDGEGHTFLVEAKKGEDIRRAVFRACVDAGLVLIGMEKLGDDLESVFMRLMEERAE
jgi:ABC-2 type transport system ATP-binding protein